MPRLPQADRPAPLGGTRPPRPDGGRPVRALPPRPRRRRLRPHRVGGRIARAVRSSPRRLASRREARAEAVCRLSPAEVPKGRLEGMARPRPGVRLLPRGSAPRRPGRRLRPVPRPVRLEEHPRLRPRGHGVPPRWQARRDAVREVPPARGPGDAGLQAASPRRVLRLPRRSARRPPRTLLRLLPQPVELPRRPQDRVRPRQDALPAPGRTSRRPVRPLSRPAKRLGPEAGLRDLRRLSPRPARGPGDARGGAGRLRLLSRRGRVPAGDPRPCEARDRSVPPRRQARPGRVRRMPPARRAGGRPDAPPSRPLPRLPRGRTRGTTRLAPRSRGVLGVPRCERMETLPVRGPGARRSLASAPGSARADPVRRVPRTAAGQARAASPGTADRDGADRPSRNRAGMRGLPSGPAPIRAGAGVLRLP